MAAYPSSYANRGYTSTNAEQQLKEAKTAGEFLKAARKFTSEGKEATITTSGGKAVVGNIRHSTSKISEPAPNPVYVVTETVSGGKPSPVYDVKGKIVAMEGKPSTTYTYSGTRQEIQQQKELQQLQSKGYDTSNIYFGSVNGKGTGGMSISPDALALKQNIYDVGYGKQSFDPDVAKTKIQTGQSTYGYAPFADQTIKYTGKSGVLGREYDPSSPIFATSYAGTKTSVSFQQQLSTINQRFVYASTLPIKWDYEGSKKVSGVLNTLYEDVIPQGKDFIRGGLYQYNKFVISTARDFGKNYGYKNSRLTLEQQRQETELAYKPAFYTTEILTAPRVFSSLETGLFFGSLYGKVTNKRQITGGDILTAGVYALPGALKLGSVGLQSVKFNRLLSPETKILNFEKTLSLQELSALDKIGVPKEAAQIRQALLPERNLLTVSQDFFNTKLLDVAERVPGVDFARTETQFLKTEGTFLSKYASLESRGFLKGVSRSISPRLLQEAEKITPSFYGSAYRGAEDVYKIVSYGVKQAGSGTYKVSPALFREAEKITPSFYGSAYRGAEDVINIGGKGVSFVGQKATQLGNFGKELTLGSSLEYAGLSYVGYETVTGLSSGRLQFQKDVLRPLAFGIRGEIDAAYTYGYARSKIPGLPFVQISRISSESLLKGQLKDGTKIGYGTYDSIQGVKFADLSITGVIKPGTAKQEIRLFKGSPFTIGKEEFNLAQQGKLLRGFSARPFTAPKYYVIDPGTSELTFQYDSFQVVPAFLKAPNRQQSSYRLGGLIPNVASPSIERSIVKDIIPAGKTSLSLEDVNLGAKYIAQRDFPITEQFKNAQATITSTYGQSVGVVPRQKAEFEFLVGGASKENKRFATVLPSEATAQTRSFFFRYGRQEAYMRVPSFKQALQQPEKLGAYFSSRAKNIFTGSNYRSGQLYKYGFTYGEGFPVVISERQIISSAPKSLVTIKYGEKSSPILETPKSSSISTSKIIKSSSREGATEVGSASYLLGNNLRYNLKSSSSITSSGSVLSSGLSSFSSNISSSLKSSGSSSTSSISSGSSSLSSSKSSISSGISSLSSSISRGYSSISSGSSTSSSISSSRSSSRSSTSRGYSSITSNPSSIISSSLLSYSKEKSVSKKRKVSNLLYNGKSAKSSVYILPDLRSVSLTEQYKFGKGLKMYEATTPKATKKVQSLSLQAFKGQGTGFVPTEEIRRGLKL